MMTVEQIEQVESNFLSVAQVADFMGAGEHFIRLQARENPDSLGFPVSVCGTRVKIPKAGFLYWYRYGKAAPSGRPAVEW